MVSKEWLEETYGQERCFEFMQHSACENMEMCRLKSQRSIFSPSLFSRRSLATKVSVSRVSFSFDVGERRASVSYPS